MIVKAVCCDMGPSNQSMWRAAGIKSKRQDSCIVPNLLKKYLPCKVKFVQFSI